MAVARADLLHQGTAHALALRIGVDEDVLEVADGRAVRDGAYESQQGTDLVPRGDDEVRAGEDAPEPVRVSV